MIPFDIIKEHLIKGMVKGNMHECLRNTGRLAGGYYQTSKINSVEMGKLLTLVRDLSINADQGEQKWKEAVNFGQKDPLDWDVESPRTEKGEGKEFDWNSEIGPKKSNEYKIIDQNWIESEEVKEPQVFNPFEQIKQYIDLLFSPKDFVAYSMESYKFDNDSTKWLPSQGVYSRTAGEILADLEKNKNDVQNCLGDYNSIAGAWIRFNPFNGDGVKDINITDHRYALVESDKLPIPKQYAIIKELQLPVVVLVHSGKKSLHAIVKIHATNYKEYQERVNFLYKVCQKNGLDLDQANRNPSRLSRMPGISRDNKKQFIIDTNIGKDNWNDWIQYVEDLEDTLPDIVAETEFNPDNEPVLSPVLIDGLLREGHKMLLTGPSKAGKSFALIQLCIAVAEGSKWFGFNVKQGRVLYINLELDKRSCQHRIWKICKTRGLPHNHNEFDVWNLRGHAVSLKELIPKLIRKTAKTKYKMVVIDPIYKVQSGDENSASDVAEFFNCIDLICTKMKTAVVCCHHHSKGEQFNKTSGDRGSGSGVFKRDPDVVLDLLQLVIDENTRKQLVDKFELSVIHKAFDDSGSDWRDTVTQEILSNAEELCKWAQGNGLGDVMREVRPEAREKGKNATAWRLDGTENIREFPSFPPRNLLFSYPLHYVDKAMFKDAKAIGEFGEKGKNKEDRKKDRSDELSKVVEICTMDEEEVTVSDIAQYLGITERTVRDRIKEHPGLVVRYSIVSFKKTKDTNETPKTE